MSSTVRVLRHAHFGNITSFARAQGLQQALVQQFLAHKALVSSTSRSPAESPLPPPPEPTILTFVPTPVYTLGRREHGSLSDEQEELLRKPLIPQKRTTQNEKRSPEYAEVFETQRGGQTTFHGPGQLVIYPILDLKPAVPFPLHQTGLTVRSYVELLEQATIDAMAEWGVAGKRTNDPGVWEDLEAQDGIPKKIAALGVHLRRNVTSYGVGLNLKTDLQWFDRIVACGLVGKGVTTMDISGAHQGIWSRRKRHEIRMAMLRRGEELAAMGIQPDYRTTHGLLGRRRLKPSIAGRAWVRSFAQGLYGNSTYYTIRKINASALGAEIERYRGEEDVR